MRNLALADLTDTDLAAMLAENETLFVEHKRGIGGDAFQVAKAICSFANTLGGWVLIGVTDGVPNATGDDGWHAVGASELTDRVREALKDNRVDPIPPFAATVRTVGDPARPLGIVRVYESDDAPHVMGNGQVFVRSVAEDRRVYRPGGVEAQTVLVDLVERGRRGDLRASDRLTDWDAPFLLGALGFVPRQALGRYVWNLPAGALGLRAAPVTGGRLEDWAVSALARDALEEAVRPLGQLGDATVEHILHISGLAARARGPMQLLPGTAERHVIASVAVDTAGILGASLIWGASSPPMEPIPVTLNGLRDALLVPLLTAVCSLLTDAELFGRSILRLNISSLDQVVEIDDAGQRTAVPGDLPIGSQISLPLSADAVELHRVADQWRGDIGRAAGFSELR